MVTPFLSGLFPRPTDASIVTELSTPRSAATARLTPAARFLVGSSGGAADAHGCTTPESAESSSLRRTPPSPQHPYFTETAKRFPCARGSHNHEEQPAMLAPQCRPPHTELKQISARCTVPLTPVSIAPTLVLMGILATVIWLTCNHAARNSVDAVSDRLHHSVRIHVDAEVRLLLQTMSHSARFGALYVAELNERSLSFFLQRMAVTSHSPGLGIRHHRGSCHMCQGVAFGQRCNRTDGHAEQ